MLVGVSSDVLLGALSQETSKAARAARNSIVLFTSNAFYQVFNVKVFGLHAYPCLFIERQARSIMVVYKLGQFFWRLVFDEWAFPFGLHQSVDGGFGADAQEDGDAMVIHPVDVPIKARRATPRSDDSILKACCGLQYLCLQFTEQRLAVFMEKIIY